MKNIVASYELDNGLKILEHMTPAEAVKLIRTGHYCDQYAPNASIFDTMGKLKGERRTPPDYTLPREYQTWWHDDDLNQIDLSLDQENYTGNPL